ncbi:ribonuclease H-like domain-containing protein, partial [Tanacetum coccineum]
GCSTTRRSTLGYCVFLGNNLLSWSFKRQPTLSRSSVEAEYRGVANAVAETCWLRNLLRELHTPLSSATLVYCDNVSAVYLSSNPVQHQRTKHIEIDIHFVRDLVATEQVKVDEVVDGSAEEDVVHGSGEEDVEQGNGQEAVEETSGEQVDYDVDGIDSAYETQYHVESSEDASTNDDGDEDDDFLVDEENDMVEP